MDAEIKRDLKKLAKIPDETIRFAARKAFIKQMAGEFQVTVGFAEVRLAGIGPFLEKETE